jgi:hypothetical protein
MNYARAHGLLCLFLTDFVAEVILKRRPNRDSVALAQIFSGSCDDGTA